MDDVVNGVRYRLPLKTKNWQEAKRLEKEKLAEIADGKLGSLGKIARQSFNVAAMPRSKSASFTRQKKRVAPIRNAAKH